MNESSVGKFNPELAKSVDSYCFLYLLGVYLFEVLKLKEGDVAFPSDPSAMGITGGSSYYTPGGELIARSYAVSDKHGLYLDFRVGSAVTDYYGRDILGSSFSGEPGWRGLKYSRELSLAVVCRLFKLLVDFWDNYTDTTVLNLVPFHHPLPGVEEEETPQPPVRRSTRRKKAAAPAPDFSRIEEFKSLYCVRELEKSLPATEIFYQQALFFADFAPSDDNANGGSLFTNGVATTLYSLIPDHLPKYFLWRTSFRNGVGSFAPPVFFGLLLSEIFNGIGCGGGIREIIKQARDVQETLYTVPLFFTQGHIPVSVQRISDWIWDFALITQPDPELLPKWLKFSRILCTAWTAAICLMMMQSPLLWTFPVRAFLRNPGLLRSWDISAGIFLPGAGARSAWHISSGKEIQSSPRVGRLCLKGGSSPKVSLFP